MYSTTELNATGFDHRQNRIGTLLILCLFSLVTKVNAQPRVPCNEITADMDFTVKSVHIQGRWVSEAMQSRIEDLVGLGKVFDPSNLNPALENVRDELVNSELDFAIRLIGSTSVLYVDAEVCDVSDSINLRQAKVSIRAYYMRIDLYNTGRNILPVPRSPHASFFREVPSLLLAVSPTVYLMNDRRFGASIGVQTSTDLLTAMHIKKPGTSKPFRLNADLDLRKSLNHPFHTAGINLEAVNPVYSDTSVGWNAGVRYAHYQQPLAKGKYTRQFFRISAAIQGNTNIMFLRKYTVGAGARFLQNRYSLNSITVLKHPENGYEFFAVSDGKLLNGFSRIGIWFDAGVPKNTSFLTTFESYQRVATRLGYGFALGSGHHNFDIETSIGGGYTWGTPPAYNLFFAGNSSSNFLYEPLNSKQNVVIPEGPVIRSLGEREGSLIASNGQLTGGNAYWHVNMSMSFPVPEWAHPLIPDVVISEEPRRVTLRSALKGQASTAKNFILDDLIENHGYPDDEQTEGVADKIIDKDIRPTLNYLADRANLYSIKPLLLFDLAGLDGRSVKHQTFFAAGIGLQVTVVVARLDFAYMHTLAPSSASGRGNMFVRFTLQNFY